MCTLVPQEGVQMQAFPDSLSHGLFSCRAWVLQPRTTIVQSFHLYVSLYLPLSSSGEKEDSYVGSWLQFQVGSPQVMSKTPASLFQFTFYQFSTRRGKKAA